jgi:hypothetical protein
MGDIFRSSRRPLAGVSDIIRTVPDRAASIRALCDADNKKARRNRHNRSIKLRDLLEPKEA